MESMVKTIEAVAMTYGDTLYTPTGAKKFGGRSMRVAGAQTLAAQGIEVTKIKLLARH